MEGKELESIVFLTYFMECLFSKSASATDLTISLPNLQPGYMVLHGALPALEYKRYRNFQGDRYLINESDSKFVSKILRNQLAN